MAQPNPTALPDLPAILGRLSDARSVIETAHRAMACGDDSDEITTLRFGLQLLRLVYNELDLAIGKLPTIDARE